jgi:hypothetical protein
MHDLRVYHSPAMIAVHEIVLLQQLLVDVQNDSIAFVSDRVYVRRDPRLYRLFQQLLLAGTRCTAAMP